MTVPNHARSGHRKLRQRRRSPVGLPLPAQLAQAPEAEKLNRLLQEIAWQAVSEHPLSGVGK